MGIETESRKMLYISLQIEESRPYIQFELEDYFPYEKRRTYAEHSFPVEVLTKEALKEDVFNLGEVADIIYVALLTDPDFCNYLGARTVMVVHESAFRNPKRIGLKIDEEWYRENPERVILGRMPLKSLDVHEHIDDPLMKMRLGMQLVKYLPLPS